MQLYLEEMRYVMLGQLEQAILNKDQQKALKFAGAYGGYTFLSVFEFKGYDENGAVLIDLPESLVASAKNKKSINDEKTASTLKKYKNLKKLRAKFKKRSVAQSNSDDILDALKDQKLSQIPYFEDLNKEGSIDSDYESNSSRFPELTELIEKIVKTMSQKGMPIDSAEELHEKNQEFVRTTILEARTYPTRYRIAKDKKVNDISDLEFPVYAARLLRTTSLRYALYAGVLNLGTDLLSGNSGFSKKLIFKSFSTLGEGLVTALGCYQGAQQMLLLQRFYSFMKESKGFHLASKEDFFPNQVAKLFDANKVYYSAEMKKETNKAWAWGLSWGLLNKFDVGKKLTKKAFVVTKTSLKLASKLTFLATDLALVGVVKLVASPNIILKTVGHTAFTIGLQVSTFKGFLAKIFGKASAATSSVLGKMYKVFVSGVKKIPGGPKIVASLVDAGMSGAFVYTAVYTRLSSTRDMLDRIHYSPEVAVYLNLNSEDVLGQESFLTASRKTFYPICHFFASRVHNFSKDTASSSQATQIKKEFEEKRQGCLRVISTIEGSKFIGDGKVLKEISIADSKVDLYKLYFESDKLSPNAVISILKSIQQDYPAHYRMTWIAGLKSIYKKDKVPEEFRLYKNQLILGRRNVATDFFEEFISLSSYKSAEHINTDRFSYSIEALALKTNELKKSKKADFKEEDEISHAEAFQVYWDYFKNNKVVTDQILRELVAKKELSWWRKIIGGLDEAFRGLKWLWDDIRTEVGLKTYGYQVDSEVSKILEGF